MKKEKDELNIIIDGTIIILICLIIFSGFVYYVNYLEKKDSKKIISIYEWENSTSVYYHNFEKIPEETSSTLLQCEDICLYLFENYAVYPNPDNNIVAVGNWHKKDCYKICKEEILN